MTCWDDGTEGRPSKFANYTKLGGVTDVPESHVAIQRDTGQAGELGRQEPHGVQQREMQSSAPRE